MKNFFKYFLKSHLKQLWFVHASSLMALLLIFYMSVIKESSSTLRVIEGILSSYVAAYIFYIFINLIPSYFQQKNALLTIEIELRNIVFNIFHILSLIQTFCEANYHNVSLPNEIVHLKNSKVRTFFNPRIALEGSIKSLNHKLANIKAKYCLLPVDMIATLNNIEETDLKQKLDALYDCIDKKYSAHIQGFPECLYTLENAAKNIQALLGSPEKIEKYELMDEKEKSQYELERQKIISSLDLHGRHGGIYLGSTRIK